MNTGNTFSCMSLPQIGGDVWCTQLETRHEGLQSGKSQYTIHPTNSQVAALICLPQQCCTPACYGGSFMRVQKHLHYLLASAAWQLGRNWLADEKNAAGNCQRLTVDCSRKPVHHIKLHQNRISLCTHTTKFTQMEFLLLTKWQDCSFLCFCQLQIFTAHKGHSPQPGFFAQATWITDYSLVYVLASSISSCCN